MTKHPFTGVDYVEYYGDLFRSQGCEVEFVFRQRRARHPALHEKRALLRHPHRAAAPSAVCWLQARRRCCCSAI